MPTQKPDVSNFSPEIIKNLSYHDYLVSLQEMNFLDPDNFQNIPIPELFSTFVQRYEGDIRTLTASKKDDDFSCAFEIGKETSLLLHKISTSYKKHELNSDLLQQLYDLHACDNQMLRFFTTESIESIAWIDHDNQLASNHPPLREQFYNEIKNRLINPPNNNVDREIAGGMLSVYFASPSLQGEKGQNGLLIECLSEAQSPESIKHAFSQLANYIGTEKTRKILRQQVKNDPSFQTKFMEIEKALDLDARSGEFNPDLVSLYQKIWEQFRNYKPNLEVQTYEDELLPRELADSSSILDTSCGPNARHLISLKQQFNDKDVHLVGIDLVPEHINAAKRLDPKIDFSVQNWHRTGFADQTFDSALCLGRSFLHNETVEEMQSFLHEMNRILTKDGVLIIDLPDPNKGHYLAERLRFAQKAEELQIENFEEGKIIDSPDGVNFYDRLTPMSDQFQAMAQLAGFEVEIIGEKDYTEPNPDNPEESITNTNVYYKLTKSNRKLSFDEAAKLNEQVRTSDPPFSIFYLQ